MSLTKCEDKGIGQSMKYQRSIYNSMQKCYPCFNQITFSTLSNSKEFNPKMVLENAVWKVWQTFQMCTYLLTLLLPIFWFQSISLRSWPGANLMLMNGDLTGWFWTMLTSVQQVLSGKNCFMNYFKHLPWATSHSLTYCFVDYKSDSACCGLSLG